MIPVHGQHLFLKGGHFALDALQFGLFLLDVPFGHAGDLFRFDIGVLQNEAGLVVGLPNNGVAQALSAEQGGADIILVVAVLHQLIRQNLQLFRQLGLFAQEGLHRIGAFINKRIHFGGFVPAHAFGKLNIADIVRRIHGHDSFLSNG